MTFADKFIKVPVIRYDREQHEILGKDPHDCDQYKSYKKINPFHIISYGPTIPEGKDMSTENETWTYLYVTGGDEFYVPITVDEFEKLLNEQK